MTLATSHSRVAGSEILIDEIIFWHLLVLLHLQVDEKRKKKVVAQPSSKRQQNANITIKAIKYNVRAFPKAASMLEGEFKGVQHHYDSPSHYRSMEHSVIYVL